MTDTELDQHRAKLFRFHDSMLAVDNKEVDITPWKQSFQDRYWYAKVNGTYITARYNNLDQQYVLKIEHKMSDGFKTFAGIALKDWADSVENFDGAAIRLYKKLQGMILALEPFKESLGK